MTNVLFTRKNASEIPNVPITDGQLIFDTSGNGKMYLDNGTERLEMGGALTVDATLSNTSTNPVQNKAVAGVMLDTLSDISNVTSKGFLADALAVKELNSSLGGLQFGVDKDGNYGYIKAGADTVIPFSNKITTESVTILSGYAGGKYPTKTVDYGKEVIPVSLIVNNTSAYVNDQYAKKVSLYGSNDNSTYTLLKSLILAQNAVYNEYLSILEKGTKFRYYKATINSNYGSQDTVCLKQLVVNVAKT